MRKKILYKLFLNYSRFTSVRIQDDAVVYAVTSPEFANPLINVETVDFEVEGGGKFHATMATLMSQNITVEDGGALRADGTGYSIYDHVNATRGRIVKTKFHITKVSQTQTLRFATS